MRRKGQPPAWTDERREQVLALADEGMTQRAIAETVFGDARYRGRVERILRERIPVRRIPEHEGEPAPEGAPDHSADPGETLSALDVSGVRRLVARFERSLHESEEAPSLADVERPCPAARPTRPCTTRRP